jgi:RNA polymerase sigma factor (TIGR02999 family)
MATIDGPEITQLLKAWGAGDQTALDRLTPLVYDRLRRLASHYVRRERAGQTLQRTALVHEAYVRLVEGGDVDWQDRGHFFAVAAQVMRRILVDAARARGAEKRGGQLERAIPESAADFDSIAAPGSDRRSRYAPSMMRSRASRDLTRDARRSSSCVSLAG